MDKTIEMHLKNKDIDALRSIFEDCLAIDPTFEAYREAYEASKKLPGFLEEYTELTPLTDDRSKWDDKYWVDLRFDLSKNFAEKRFVHLKKVAQVYYAEKIERILVERKLAKTKDDLAKRKEQYSQKSTQTTSNNVFQNQRVISEDEIKKENADLEKAKADLAKENEEIDRKIEREKANRQRKREQYQQTQTQTPPNKEYQKNNYHKEDGVSNSKKVGKAIAIAAVAAVAIVVVVLIVKNL